MNLIDIIISLIWGIWGVVTIFVIHEYISLVRKNWEAVDFSQFISYFGKSTKTVSIILGKTIMFLGLILMLCLPFLILYAIYKIIFVL